MYSLLAWLLFVPSSAFAQASPPYPAYMGNFNGEGTLHTYSSSSLPLTVAAAATDIWCIGGSATRIVRVSSIRISGTATQNAVVDVVILRRSAANTGGSSLTDAGIVHDTKDPAATATVTTYSANPSLGTLVGDMRSQKITVSTVSGPNVNIVPVLFSFANLDSKVATLRGTAENLCVNLNGQTINGGNFDVDAQWTEN